ncbi:MAG: hypothetical protein KAG28_01035 [Cocleimonas sp.]|nr:hypothetical protein [Cocleimonas sp.]
MKTPFSLKEAQKNYARLGFSIKKTKNYYQAERKNQNIFVQSERIDLLCQVLHRLT